MVLLVYDLAGYIINARPFLTDHWKDCKKSLVSKDFELPEDFSAANYTILRNKGGLIFVIIPMFLSLQKIESKTCDHFANESHVYKSDSYELYIGAIS